MFLYEKLRAAVLRKGYIWYNESMKLNCIWERNGDIITNKFTDWLHIAYHKNGVQSVLTIAATTKPGLKGSILEPITVEGVTGTAIIKPDQYINAWQFRDTYTEFSKYPYFRQVGKLDYWRDGDKDVNIDRVQDQEDRLFGTHWHVMSRVGTYGTGEINNWSLGCMGAAEPEYKKILPIVRESVKVHGVLFTGTIIYSNEF